MSTEEEKKESQQSQPEESQPTPEPEKAVEPEATESAPSPEPTVTTPPTEALEANKDARMWAMFCHLAAFAWFLFPWMMIANIIVPFIIWQIKKDDFSFVDEQGKEAVNFQISLTIYIIIAVVLCLACVGYVLTPVLFIIGVAMTLIASVKSNEGKHFRYPLTIRFFK